MAKVERPVQLSVIDRLIDERPTETRESIITRTESVARLKASVLRDLNLLLNTRRLIEEVGEGYPEVKQSLYYFGIPDTTTHGGESEESRAWLMRQIEEAIELFEPRLTSVRAVPTENEGPAAAHQLRFVIEAVLRMEPQPERVLFDAVLEATNGEFQVSGGNHA